MFEATFYVVVHGRILAIFHKFKVGKLWAPTAPLPHDQNELLVPHLKDLVHIYVEPEYQRHGMAFRAIFIRSKYPQIIS